MVTTTLPSPTLNPLDWTWQGHSIRYTVAGQGKPVVLIHGFGASIGHWRKNIPDLAAGGYQVFALDLLGFGASAKPNQEYSLELWQDLLCDFWQEKIQQPTVFVGNSIGALLALMLAANHPDKTTGAVLLNCAGGLNHGSGDINPVFRGIMGFFTNIVNSEFFGPIVFNQVRRKSQIRRTLYQVYGNPEAVTSELVDMLYEPSCHEGAQKVFAAILRAPSGPTPAELLERLERPVLVLWGEKDPWAPVSVGRRMFQPHTEEPSLQFASIPKTGHCPHDERPEEVNPRILDWLRHYH
ncbi:MAG: alpha/beta fold hydrolase [Prochlorothrix sp.]